MRMAEMAPGGRAARARLLMIAASLAMLAVAAPAAAAPRASIDNAAYHPDRSDAALIAMVARLDSVPAPFVDSCGAGTVCLTVDHRLRLSVDKHSITSSHVFRVRDPEGSPAVTRRLQFERSARIERAATWILRDGAIIRHESSSAQVVKGGKDTPTELVIAVPDVRAGDVVGWSYVHSHDFMYWGDNWYMSEVVPTRRATLLMLADDDISYRTYGGNLREGCWRRSILDKSPSDNGRKVYWVMTDVDGRDDGPLAPPATAILPSVQISCYSYYKGKRWNYIRHWNDVAFNIDSWYSYVLASNLDVRKAAVRATAGLTDPLEQLDALRRFVSDRIVLVSPWETASGPDSAADVLRLRSGDGVMAGALLCAMAVELGLKVRPILARSVDAGPFDESIHGRLQFTDLLVEPVDHLGTYFSAVGVPGPNRELPYHLLGARAMWVQTGLQAEVRRIDEEAWQAGKSHSMERYEQEFEKRIRAQRWHGMFTLPGDPNDCQGEVAEDVTWTAGSDTVSVELRASGHLDRLDLSPAAPRPAAAFADYCRWRFPGASLSDTAAAGDGGGRRGRLQATAPEPEGDTWTITPSFVHGNGFLPEWSPGETAQVFCPATRRHVRTWRMRVPPGWVVAAGPRPVSADVPRLSVQATASVRDGELVVEQRWEWRRGVTVRAGLVPLGAAIAAMREFAGEPIVMVRE